MRINKPLTCLLLVAIICLLFLDTALAKKETRNFELRGGNVYLNLKEADIKTVLQIFAKATRTNIVASDDVTGTISVTFTGVSPMKGLETVLRSKGLDWFEEGDTIYVTTKKVMRAYYLEYARPSDIAETVKTILPEGSKISVDDSYNVLVIQAASDNLIYLEKLIKELDVPPTQVMIEVKMIEVRREVDQTAGVDLKYTSPTNPNNVLQTTNLAGKSTASGAQGLYAHVLSGNIESYLSALGTAAKYNTIATPRITTISNKEANLLIGSKLGYMTTVTTGTMTTQQVAFLEIGTSLKLTPHVSKSGYIRMEVQPKISDGSVTDNIPSENTTETKNEVVVKDGQTFVIGGLIKDKETETNYGLPFIMDIPFLGALFRRTVISKDKQELLVFVTPHLLSAEMLESVMPSQIKALEDKSAKEGAQLIH